jgi:hypothetical protein
MPSWIEHFIISGRQHFFPAKNLLERVNIFPTGLVFVTNGEEKDY